jgi:hypothetical protein
MYKLKNPNFVVNFVILLFISYVKKESKRFCLCTLELDWPHFDLKLGFTFIFLFFLENLVLHVKCEGMVNLIRMSIFILFIHFV